MLLNNLFFSFFLLRIQYYSRTCVLMNSLERWLLRQSTDSSGKIESIRST